VGEGFGVRANNPLNILTHDPKPQFFQKTGV